ncbi:MAG: DUF370 domain-containing protein [Oscillospiraceae bacterium]|nr:DUF370 domain-containing protein [Oscillospiraceae bacterium]
MYLHLGKNAVVARERIVGIFDLDTASHSHLTREYLKKAQISGQIVNISDDLPKSFVVCRDKEENGEVYLSQLNSSTLMKRCEAADIE